MSIIVQDVETQLGKLWVNSGHGVHSLNKEAAHARFLQAMIIRQGSGKFAVTVYASPMAGCQQSKFPQPAPAGQVMLFSRLRDAKFAAESMLWAYGCTFDHIEDARLRAYLERMVTLPTHAETAAMLATTGTALIADIESDLDLKQDLRGDLYAAADSWGVVNNASKLAVAHALLRVYWGVDL